MRKQKINWFFPTSRSCSVAFPSLSGDEAQNHVLMCRTLVSPAPQKCPLDSKYSVADGSGPGHQAWLLRWSHLCALTTCLSFRESKGPFIAYLPHRAEIKVLCKCQASL